jgi:hypothetical protein
LKAWQIVADDQAWCPGNGNRRQVACKELRRDTQRGNFKAKKPLKFDICKSLVILRDHDRMRVMIWIVGLLALATSLDSSLYGGFYTRGTMRMLSDMAVGFGFY